MQCACPFFVFVDNYVFLCSFLFRFGSSYYRWMIIICSPMMISETVLFLLTHCIRFGPFSFQPVFVASILLIMLNNFYTIDLSYGRMMFEPEHGLHIYNILVAFSFFRTLFIDISTSIFERMGEKWKKAQNKIPAQCITSSGHFPSSFLRVEKIYFYIKDIIY